MSDVVVAEPVLEEPALQEVAMESSIVVPQEDRSDYIGEMISVFKQYCIKRVETLNIHTPLRNSYDHLIEEDDLSSLVSVAGSLMFGASYEQLISLAEKLKADDEKIRGKIDYLISHVYKDYEHPVSSLSRDIFSNEDFEVLVKSKIKNMIPLTVDNINLLAGSESPVLMMETPEKVAFHGWQARFIIGLSSLYAWSVYATVQDWYANGIYQRMDESVRDAVEQICVNCLTVIAKSATVNSISELSVQSLVTMGIDAEKATTPTAERTLAAILWINQGEDSVIEPLLECVYEQAGCYLENAKLTDIDMYDEFGMASITTNKRTWQPVFTHIFGLGCCPVNTQPIDVGSALMLDEYKKTRIFSFCLLGMQTSMFAYLVKNDDDLFLYTTIQAVSDHIAKVVPLMIPYAEEEVQKPTTSVVLSAEASSFVKAIYGFYLTDFLKANPHVSLAV